MTKRTIEERLRLAAEPDWQGFPQFRMRTPELLHEAAAEIEALRTALAAAVARRDQVEALSDAMWQLLDDMGAEGTSVCHSAKASARIAYEPFRVDADGEEAPVAYPLEEAERMLGWIRDGLRHELSRPMTILPWSDEPVSPVIKVEDVA
ncbi:hypothetical protein NS228_04975 [Methylobacterium indicum]|uniref:hypothetical protein n=1 Tax=Methylobacterium indicum TaxID=1775910 RepID=UPI000734A356|nr:hypothetical protein [Methylobacterium indicum]KTS39513.1 hypothetical protein NS229_00090 [Methylobacterium indicum]KTS41739.1 hypothetical protein NS228_04975 [Methylobacterium indicum]KTS53523.1 hypothetical protein NS230_05480 [Methylobacterium indicum]